MEKRIYLLLLSIVVIFFSCKDDSGNFEEQLFTNTEITRALSKCIEVASDSTLNALCVVDTLFEKHGYYYYDSKAYRIELPTAARQMVDTLTKYGFEEALDTLIFNINRAAEQCGNKIKSDFLNLLIKNISFPNPHQTLHGGNTAITDYVKTTKLNEFISLLNTTLLLPQFNTLNVLQKWNMFQEEYYKITDRYTSIDILSSSSQQVANGFFKKMALQEEAIRKNPDLRGAETDILYKVFKTLDH
ncbi:MAG: DUF4197 domain-containing protein [Lentimicrobiaceae bacterium]|nr:DUF4197 domain-containing protein [Lentimicrobiaceae bacterium]